MLRIVEDAKQLARANSALIKLLQDRASEKIPGAVGFQGGREEGDLLWIEDLGFWFSGLILDNRYWNAFGLGKPDPKSASIVCEVNFPLGGIDRSIGGVIAEDERGNLYVAHRGKIGGGRVGIGKALFEQNYPTGKIEVQDGDRTSYVTMIGSMDSRLLPKRVATFVKEVRRIKELVGTEQPHHELQAHGFNEEFSGTKVYNQAEIVEANCTHGLVVSELRSLLSSWGLSVANDRNRDLYVYDAHGRMTTLVEVKTNLTLTDTYTAVGQLLLNSIGTMPLPRLVFVAPAGIGERIVHALARLQVTVWQYHLTATGDIEFINLSKASATASPKV